MATDTLNTKVILRDVRGSYVNVFEPRQNDAGENEYSMTVLIPKDGKPDPKTGKTNKQKIDEVVAGIQAAVKAANKGKMPPKFKLPLRDGDSPDEAKSADANYNGHWFMNVKSKTKPDVVGRELDADNKPKKLEPGDFYSGAFCHVSVNFFSYDTKGNTGIGVGLNNIMKTKDGPALAGKSTAAEDFRDLLDEADEADLDLG